VPHEIADSRPLIAIAGVTEEAHRALGMMAPSEMLRVLPGQQPHVLANADLWPRLAHLK
jgi:hypothetical protein